MNWIALIKSSAVRDVQYATQPDAELTDDNAWLDMPNAEIFLQVYKGMTESQARERAAAYAQVHPDNIRLIQI